jgi:indole-3-glycerol phosphate synthase
MTVLDRIFARKAEEVAGAKLRVSQESLRAEAEARRDVRGFRAALAAYEGLALIAEVKKASPSKGVIRENFDPASIAAEYEQAGAQCLSVLTDEQFFQGSAENLRLARSACALPVLRKDFINDPYQVFEARAWGADAILLITTALDQHQITDLHALATQLGMDVLVEVHTESEAEMALGLGCDLIGVNNRNLADFSTDLGISEQLIPRIASNAMAVSESALETRRDLDRVAAVGAKAVLIGTSFCAAANIGAKVHEVMGR